GAQDPVAGRAGRSRRHGGRQERSRLLGRDRNPAQDRARRLLHDPARKACSRRDRSGSRGSARQDRRTEPAVRAQGRRRQGGERLGREHVAESRRRLKRVLLDALDERHKFEVPPTLLDEEFANVWRTVVADLESQKRSFADESTTEEAAKAEYRGIAERRVRLGLVIA